MLKRRLVLATALSLGAVAAASLAWSAGTSPREAASARAAVPACAGRASIDLACQVGRYGAITRTSGVGAAFAQLKRAYDREGFVRAACHPIVHEIGHAAVARYGPRLSHV